MAKDIGRNGIKKSIVYIICIFTLLLCGCSGKEAKLTVRQEEVDIRGFDGEFKIYFLADSLMSLCDDRDPDVLEKAASRKEMFMHDGMDATETFDSIMKDASSRKEDILILGGDIIDSAMYESIDYLTKELKKPGVPYIYYMGNHDFEYGTEYFSEKAYSEYLPRLDELHGDASYQVKEYDDLILFAADDENSQISAEALSAYREIAEKGKPVILLLHVPIEPLTDDTSLLDKCIEVWGPSDAGKSRVTMGVNGCYPNETTAQFLDLVLAEDSPVELVLAGHVHFYHRDMLNDHTLQLITGAAFEGESMYITVR